MHSSLAASHNLVPLSWSTIAMVQQVGQKRAKHVIRHQAREVSGSFMRLTFLFLLRWHLLNLSVVPSTPPRWAGVQAQVSDECGQGLGQGQEQGVGRLGGMAGAQAGRAQTWAVWARLGAVAKPGQSQMGSASWVRVACLVDGGPAKKIKLICFYCIQLHLSINIVA